jgi:hypothetical protein
VDVSDSDPGCGGGGAGGRTTVDVSEAGGGCSGGESTTVAVGTATVSRVVGGGGVGGGGGGGGGIGEPGSLGLLAVTKTTVSDDAVVCARAGPATDKRRAVRTTRNFILSSR